MGYSISLKLKHLTQIQNIELYKTALSYTAGVERVEKEIHDGASLSVTKAIQLYLHQILELSTLTDRVVTHMEVQDPTFINHRCVMCISLQVGHGLLMQILHGPVGSLT